MNYRCLVSGGILVLMVSAVTGCAGTESGAGVNGETAFNQYCSKCHDNTLTGEGGGMAYAPVLEALFLLPSETVRAALLPGSKHSSYTEVLPRQTREALVEFLNHHGD